MSYRKAPPDHPGHIVYESPQVRAGILAPSIGKACWQSRPYDGLRDPAAPGRMFTPNEMYAALVEAVGYVPVILSADDYVELLPARWRHRRTARRQGGQITFWTSAATHLLTG